MTKIGSRVVRTLHVRVAAAAVTAALAMAGCSASSGAPGTHSSSKAIVVVGTTDQVTALDPAGSWDLPSWTVIYNVFQELLEIEPGTTKIVPDAGSCAFRTPTEYSCAVKPGQRFSNGDPVTAADVAYSFQRVRTINAETGASELLEPMKAVTSQGDRVTFTLKRPDAVWPYILTTGAGAIVDPKVFPADKLLSDGDVVGSGPYRLADYVPQQEAELRPNPYYAGPDQLANSGVVIRYEQSASTLISDLETGAVDVGYRELNPTELTALSKTPDISVVQGPGAEIRYVVFNQNQQPGATSSQKLAVRQAAAEVVDRSAIARDIYHQTVAPLYSVVPAGLAGATPAFRTAYGAGPDIAAARRTLAASGVTSPVSLTLWYNVNHYGDADLATEVQRELNASGLFDVQLRTAEWSTYQADATSGDYQAYLYGWFPDYPDADDYVTPFLPCRENIFTDHFCSPEIDSLLHQEARIMDPSKRDSALARIQQLTASAAALLPLWQSNQIAAVRNDVTGIRSTLDPSYALRLWLVGKSD